MGVIKTFKCDEPGCEKLKKESNHWWVVQKKNSVILQIAPLDSFHDLSKGDLDPSCLIMCGREHVQKAVERFMEEVGK